MEARKVNIHDVIDDHRIGCTQYVALLLCALLMLFDGFNTQTISYIVPVLADEWHLPKSILGTIFSAAFVGLLIGNFGISPLANRFGPKKMTVCSTAAFGLFTLSTVLVTNALQLIAFRPLTGIALGAAAPCAIGLTSEFSPKRTRATFVLLIYVGYSFGFTIAGFCCGAMIPHFGWAGPLWVGGLGAIALTALLIPFLPECASYVARNRSPIDLLRTAQRFFPKFILPRDAVLTSNEDETSNTHKEACSPHICASVLFCFGPCSSSTWRNSISFKAGYRRYCIPSPIQPDSLSGQPLSAQSVAWQRVSLWDH